MILFKIIETLSELRKQIMIYFLLFMLSGLFIIGLLESGNIFLWHKDQDFLKMVTGLSNIAPTENIRPGKMLLCALTKHSSSYTNTCTHTCTQTHVQLSYMFVCVCVCVYILFVCVCEFYI